MFIRLNILYRGLDLPSEFCEVICRKSSGTLFEYWLKCRDVSSLISMFKAVASYGVLIAIGSLSGRVLRSLPSSLDDLLFNLAQDSVLSAGIGIIVRSCSNNNVVSVVEALSPYARKVSIKPSSNLINVVLSRPVSASILFDLGIRLLKPSITPPILLKVKKHRTSTSESVNS